MYKSLLAFFILSNALSSLAQQHNNMYQLSVYDDVDFTTNNTEAKYSSSWGWSGNGAECAVFGSRDYTYFLDVTNPISTKLILRESGAAKDVTWREYRTFGNYVYAVNDGANGTLQIFDMSNFPLSVTKVYDSNTLITRSHTLLIEDSILYLFGARSQANGSFTLGMYSLKQSPAEPQLLQLYTNPSAIYIHDGIVRDGKLYAFSGYDGLWVYDVSNPQNIQILSSVQNYPASGYCHSGAFSKDGKYLYLADEVPINLPLKIFDVSNPQNINYIDTFRARQGYTAHNPFVKGDSLYVSYYEEGVHVWDISKPTTPVKAANFDTYPRSNDAKLTYNGCWNVYPYFPSGNVAAIDRKFGLYMIGFGVATSLSQKYSANLLVYPNPVLNNATIVLNEVNSNVIDVKLLSTLGQVVYQQRHSIHGNKIVLENLSDLEKGIYILQIQSQNQTYLCRIVK